MDWQNLFPGIYQIEGTLPNHWDGEGILVLPNQSKLSSGEHMTCVIRLNGVSLRIPTPTAKEWINILQTHVEKYDK